MNQCSNSLSGPWKCVCACLLVAVCTLSLWSCTNPQEDRLKQYRFHETLGMTTAQLIKVLRKQPGIWKIWQNYATGGVPGNGLSGHGYDFVLNNDRVWAIHETISRAHPAGVVSDIHIVWRNNVPQIEWYRMIKPWEELLLIDERGSLVKGSATSTQFMDMFTIKDTGDEDMNACGRKLHLAIDSIRKEWHRRHPGVRIYIDCDPRNPCVSKSSGNSRFDKEALDLSRNFMREVPDPPYSLYNPYDRDNAGLYNIRVE
jgi:hypothetical protein